MGIRDILKISRKTFLDPVGWLGVSTLSIQHNAIKSNIRAILAKSDETTHKKESFDHAMKRFGLKEKDIKAKISRYTWYVWSFLILGIFAFLYGFHFLFLKRIFAWILGMVSSLLFFSQAFKYHFWAYQLRVRKLGVKYAEWKKDLLS